jgi:hypothetical protein
MEKTRELMEAQEENERNRAIADKAAARKYAAEVDNMQVEWERKLREADDLRKLETAALKLLAQGATQMSTHHGRRLDAFGGSEEFVLRRNDGVRDYKADPKTVQAIDAVHANDDYISSTSPTRPAALLNLKDKSETNIGL